MLGRVIIIVVGAGFASYCVVTAFLTFFGKNAATLHLTKIFLIGYAAVNAVLTPFGISGVIGGISRKKTLIRAFITIQWWSATFILIGLNVFNIVLSRRDKGDFVRRCQNNLAKGQPESDFLTRCVAIADDAERATFIATCAEGGIMLFLGIVLLIVGTREYNAISFEEETNNLLEKANFNEKYEDKLENPSNTNNNNGGNVNDSTFVPDSYDLGRYPPTNMTNVKRQPSNAVSANVNLVRHPTDASTINAVQNSGLRRHPTDTSATFIGRNQTDPNFIPSSYKGLSRNATSPGSIPPRGLARYPTDGSANIANVTRQPTIGSSYAPRNYVKAPQAIHPMAPKRSLSTKQYINPPLPSYITQITIPHPQINKQNIPPISEVNEYNNYNNDYNYNPKPYSTKTMTPYLTRK